METMQYLELCFKLLKVNPMNSLNLLELEVLQKMEKQLQMQLER